MVKTLYSILHRSLDLTNYVTGKYNIYAFYNNCDMNYCEDCEEDLQIFYSFIVLQNNEVYYKLPIID